MSEVLAEFVRGLEGATDPEAVVADFSARYPDLAEEFRGLARMSRMMDASRQACPGPMPLRLGEFRILRTLVRGSLSAVYEAVQEPLGRRVAVKAVRTTGMGEEVRQRFLREQAVLARMHQTNVVAIHTAGQEGGVQYFAMPYIEGASLAEILRFSLHHPGPLPALADLARQARLGPGTFPPGSTFLPRPSLTYLDSVATAIAEAAQALDHAHAQGIVHRDVKPSNLLLDVTGRCWTIDFGLAAFLSSEGERLSQQDFPALPAASGILGTPSYMAPEQFAGRADPRSDVWGLGATLYELLTFHRPFDAPDLESLARQIRDTPPPVMRGVPADLAAICRKALQRDPSARYTSAAALAEDLRRWLRREPVEARPAWPPRRLLLWARREPGWAVAVALAVAAGLAGALGWGVLERARSRDRQREILVQRLQRLRLTAADAGWSARAWGLVEEAAAVRLDEELQAEAAASLGGLDARVVARLPGRGANSLAFLAGGLQLRLDGPGTPAQVWDLSTGTLTPTVPLPWPTGVPRPDAPAVLALSPDQTQLAVGDEEGRITLRDTTRNEQAAVLQAGRAALRSLAWGRSPVRGRGESDWWLAAGDSGGRVTLWDVARRLPLTHCHGSNYDVLAVALSPDGTLIASGGRQFPRLWDTRTGRLLLQLDSPMSYITALAFSADGRRLAAASRPPGEAGEVVVWELGQGREIQVLRGLHAPVGQVRLSDDGRFVAALSHSWELAVWDRRHATLLHLFDLPRGVLADNAAVVFRPGGGELFWAAGAHARLWDTFRGAEKGAWSLPVGLVDRAAFLPGGVLLFRVETRDGREGPFGPVDRRLHPRVCRGRLLLPGGALQEQYVITDFNWLVFSAAMSDDGSRVFVEGEGGPNGRDRFLACFNARTGETLFRLRLDKAARSAGLALDPPGRLLAFRATDGPGHCVLDAGTWEVEERPGPPPGQLGPGGRVWVRGGPHARPGTLAVGGTGGPWPLLAIDAPGATPARTLCPVGRFLAWGCEDGRVTVCDLPALRQRLAGLEQGRIAGESR